LKPLPEGEYQDAASAYAEETVADHQKTEMKKQSQGADACKQDFVHQHRTCDEKNGGQRVKPVFHFLKVPSCLWNFYLLEKE
jgi:hypothetical protein